MQASTISDHFSNSCAKIPSKHSAATRTQDPTFSALIALGPKITPLVVQKLTQPFHFFAVELYNKLEANLAYKVNNPKDLANYKFLQRQASLIVSLNLSWHY